MLMQLHNILLRTAPRLVRGCVLLPPNQTRRCKECFGRFRYTQWEPFDKHVRMKRKERPDRDGALRKTHCDELVAIVKTSSLPFAWSWFLHPPCFAPAGLGFWPQAIKHATGENVARVRPHPNIMKI